MRPQFSRIRRDRRLHWISLPRARRLLLSSPLFRGLAFALPHETMPDIAPELYCTRGQIRTGRTLYKGPLRRFEYAGSLLMRQKRRDDFFIAAKLLMPMTFAAKSLLAPDGPIRAGLTGAAEKRLHEDFGNFQPLLAEGRLEGIHDSRIEIGSGSFYDGVPGVEGREALAIRTVGDERIVYIGDADDHGFEGYLLAFGGMVTGAIK